MLAGSFLGKGGRGVLDRLMILCAQVVLRVFPVRRYFKGYCQS